MPDFVWHVPVTIVEHRRVAVVEAASKSEARRKARAAEWVELTDAVTFTVRIVGAVTGETDA